MPIVLGVPTTLQSGAGAAFNKALGRSVLVGFVVVGTDPAACLAAIPMIGSGWPTPERFAQAPRIGRSFVPAVILFADRPGAAVLPGPVVTVRVVTSLALDHIGLPGFERHTAGVGRITIGARLTGRPIVMSPT